MDYEHYVDLWRDLLITLQRFVRYLSFSIHKKAVAG